MPTSDETFMADVSRDPATDRLVLEIRKAVARMCCIPHELISAGEKTDVLASIIDYYGDTNWDETTFLQILGEQLGVNLAGAVELPFFVTGKVFFLPIIEGPRDFGTWTNDVAHRLLPVLSVQHH
jgi:hypothetical protein